MNLNHRIWERPIIGTAHSLYKEWVHLLNTEPVKDVLNTSVASHDLKEGFSVAQILELGYADDVLIGIRTTLSWENLQTVC